jgi:hypothetical protein
VRMMADGVESGIVRATEPKAAVMAGRETVAVTLDLPVSAPLSATVRALEAARDAQLDSRAKQALAMAAALASRGLMEHLARPLKQLRNHQAGRAGDR